MSRPPVGLSDTKTLTHVFVYFQGCYDKVGQVINDNGVLLGIIAIAILLVLVSFVYVLGQRA